LAENADVVKTWCDTVAALGVDVLVDHELVRKEDFERATEIVAEEILVRLSMGDYPPPSGGPS
jgi:hypothetical protein